MDLYAFAEIFKFNVLVYTLGSKPLSLFEPKDSISSHRCLVLYGGHQDFQHFQLLVHLLRKPFAEKIWKEKQIKFEEMGFLNYRSHKTGISCLKTVLMLKPGSTTEDALLSSRKLVQISQLLIILKLVLQDMMAMLKIALQIQA